MRKIFKSVVAVVIVFVLTFGVSELDVFAASHGMKYNNAISTPSNYANYNCYGYAIGTHANIDPGHYSSRTSTNIATFRQCIMADLTALGYTNVRAATSASASMNTGEIMLAYYYGSFYSPDTGIIATISEYHFWVRSNGSSTWTHKFGTDSGLMSTDYVPSSSAMGYICDEYYNAYLSNPLHPAFMYAYSGSVGYIIAKPPVNDSGYPEEPSDIGYVTDDTVDHRISVEEAIENGGTVDASLWSEYIQNQ